MARMHARRKGKHGSVRPQWTRKPTWISYTPEDVEKLVVEKAREGLSSAMIGTILRDSYGVPSIKKITDKSVTQIMQENKLTREFPEDFLNLVRKAWRMRQHLETKKNDLHNKRSLHLIESKIRRLVKYYRSTGIVAEDFKYEYTKAPLYLR